MRKKEKGASTPKKKIRKIRPSQTIKSRIEILDYENGVTSFVRHGKKEFVCILKIYGIDIFHYSETDMSTVFDNYASAESSLDMPHRYVFTDTRPVLESQLRFLRYKQAKAKQGFTKAYLRNRIEYLEDREKNHFDGISYLLLFSEESDKLLQKADEYISKMKDTQIEICTRKQAKEFLTSLFEGTDNIFPSEIEFKQNMVVTPSGCSTTIIVNDYPTFLANLEIASLISRIDGVTFFYDVEQKNKSEVLEELRKSIKELNSRAGLEMELTDEQDTALELQKLSDIRNNITNGAKQMLYVTLRIVVTDTDIERLGQRVNAICKLLQEEGISSFVPINEMKEEYFSRLSVANTVKTPFPLHDTYAPQFPFYYQAHLDESCLPFGISGTGGLVGIDFFFRDTSRQSYDMLLCGVKGSGKSVTLKSLIADYVALGNKVMVLDVESEYGQLAKMFDGQVITFTKNTKINPLQMHMTVNKRREENSDRESELEMNYAAEISRMVLFVGQYIPNMTPYQKNILTETLTEVFVSVGIAPETDITKLNADDFPCCKNVLALLESRLYVKGRNGYNSELTKQRTDALENLYLTFKTICTTYGSMFDGYSTVNIED